MKYTTNALRKELHIIRKCLNLFSLLKEIYLIYSANIWAIYKTRNTGMGNGMRGTQGMFTRIPGNLLEDSGGCSHFSIPGNAREDSGECSRRLRGILEKILGNVRKDSGESSRRFRGILLKIPGNS